MNNSFQPLSKVSPFLFCFSVKNRWQKGLDFSGLTTLGFLRGWSHLFFLMIIIVDFRFQAHQIFSWQKYNTYASSWKSLNSSVLVTCLLPYLICIFKLQRLSIFLSLSTLDIWVKKSSFQGNHDFIAWTMWNRKAPFLLPYCWLSDTRVLSGNPFSPVCSRPKGPN